MQTTLTVAEVTPTDADYAAMAAFRFELRSFLRAISEVAEAAGLTPQQHQVLLAIRGRGGRGATVGWIADQMFIQPNSASELIGRLEVMGLVRRATADHDRRRSDIALTDAGERLLARVSARHLAEIAQLKPMLLALLDRL